MSYCRWSCDNFRCDLYCYEDARGGYTTHVAGNKPVGEIPSVDWTLMERQPEGFVEEFLRQYNAQSDWLGSCERKPIGLAHDGESFNDPDLASFRDRLLMLRAAGYHFPDYVIESVEQEIRECNQV